MKKLSYVAPLPILALVAYLAARDGLRPPPSQCVAVEMVGLPDDDPDAGRAQMLLEVCNLGGEDASLDSLLKRVCFGPASKQCNVVGIPVEDRTPEQRACMKVAMSDCEERAPGTGGVVWMSAPYPVESQTQEVRRLTREQFRAKGCACPNLRDAGVACRTYIPGADAGPFVRLAHPGEVLDPGKWVGLGCVPTPCTGSEVRESVPGCDWRTTDCMLPEECKP